MGENLRPTASGIAPRQVTEKHRFPRQTMQDRSQRKSSSMEQYQRISRNKEEQICHWALALAAEGEAPTYAEIVRHASHVLRESGDTKPLGKNWINGFVRRYPSISILKTKTTDCHSDKSFWESTEMSQENSERAATSFSAFVQNTFALNGLPQQILGVRPLSNKESAIHDANPSLTMACRENNGNGVTVLSTDRLRTLSEEISTAASSWNYIVEGLYHVIKQNSLPRRILCDPGHSNLEWSVFENITMSLTELALDPKEGPQPIFRKSLEILGKVKVNKEVTMDQLGCIVGRSWFMCPSAPTLNINSAGFICNQTMFQAIDLDKKDNMLPWVYITTFAGPFPATPWVRYISSQRGESHLQFHAKYITSKPTSTSQSCQADNKDGFCILRDTFNLSTSSASVDLLSEGRVSVAVKTTTGFPESYYSAVTLADCTAFQGAASGVVWDEKFAPRNCGRLTGIAVFQAIVYYSIRICEQEHEMTEKVISELFARLDEINTSVAQDLMEAVLGAIRRTTGDIKRLAEDCREAMKELVDDAKDGQATNNNSVIEERWDALVSLQEKIGREYLSKFEELRLIL